MVCLSISCPAFCYMLGASGGRHEPLILDFKYGQHANSHSVLATQAIANVVKSSFGPSGLDKMMVDDIGVCNLALLALRSTISHTLY